MEDAIIIIPTVLLLFLFIYVYTFGGEFLRRRKAYLRLKRRTLLVKKFKAQQQKLRELRAEKLEKLRQRRTEIKAQLKWLARFKKQIAKRLKEKEALAGQV